MGAGQPTGAGAGTLASPTQLCQPGRHVGKQHLADTWAASSGDPSRRPRPQGGARRTHGRTRAGSSGGSSTWTPPNTRHALPATSHHSAADHDVSKPPGSTQGQRGHTWTLGKPRRVDGIHTWPGNPDALQAGREGHHGKVPRREPPHPRRPWASIRGRTASPGSCPCPPVTLPSTLWSSCEQGAARGAGWHHLSPRNLDERPAAMPGLAQARPAPSSQAASGQD